MTIDLTLDDLRVNMAISKLDLPEARVRNLAVAPDVFAAIQALPACPTRYILSDFGVRCVHELAPGKVIYCDANWRPLERFREAT